MKLSVVIPAYNEATRIGPTLDILAEYLGRQPYESEVVVVDDGSTDGTCSVVEGYSECIANLRYLANDKNRGKGYTVRHGAMEARGDFILFFDADSSTPIEQVEKFWPLFEKGCDVCIGSRSLPGSDIVVHQPLWRETVGRCFNLLVRIFVIGGIIDTQCGFKAMTKKAAEITFPKQTLSGFGFDVELLYIADKYGFRISEVPIKWINSPDSRVGTTSGMKAFWELILIRYNDAIGAYR